MARHMKRVIDLHCDTIGECARQGIGLVNDRLHISLHKRPRNMLYCQCMAIFMPDGLRGAKAEAHFGRVYQCYEKQLRLHGDQICGVTDLRGIGRALDSRPFASVLTVEGGSVLAGKLENVGKLHELGVRMITLTWNAENELCGGCGTDKGFTSFGRSAVGEMERLGIAVDVSHLSDRGFAELCEFSARPFVASHSNSRAVCAHRRNLTDGMFAAIKERGGLVGLNYYKNFITEDGESDSIGDLLRHVHHFLELGGEDTLALGSDFDGAEMPAYLDSFEKVEHLEEAMEKSGIPAGVVEKIRCGNALRFFHGLKPDTNPA